MYYKILLTGSNGTLSSSIKEKYQCLEIRNDSNAGIYEVITKNTVSDEKVFILHFAAETNVDLCEQDKLLAINSNYVMTKDLVDIIKNYPNIVFVFISSASIFNGKEKIKYKEDDKTEPANFYALTKLLAEQYIIQNVNKYFIFRFAWLMGNPEVDNKFIGKIFQQIREKKKVLFGVNNVFGSLTFADDFASDLRKVFEEMLDYGTYNYATDSNISRYDIIKKIIDYYNLNKQFKIKPASIADFILIAKRPKYELLSIEKICKHKFISEINWEVSMERYLGKYKDLVNE